MGYEHATGRRRTGETADAGFQIGVQRVIPLGQAELWDLLTSEVGALAWLAPRRRPTFEPGERFETLAGLGGEIRTVKPGQRLRLTLEPSSREGSTTLQLSLSCPRDGAERTSLRFHHEKLADGAERERMRRHWSAILDVLSALAAR